MAHQKNLLSVTSDVILTDAGTDFRINSSDLTGLPEWIENISRAAGIPSDQAYEVNIAIDEAVSNILTHGYEANTDIQILVRAISDPYALILVIDDNARSFDPLKVPPPDIRTSVKERSIGGMGVHFLKALMDEVHYERVGSSNRLTLIKYAGRRNV